MSTFERKCRSCGKWSTVDGLKEPCSFCHADYGHFELGLDVLRKVDADEAVDPKTAKPKKLKPVVQMEAPKGAAPQPGEFGYVSPKKKERA